MELQKMSNKKCQIKNVKGNKKGNKKLKQYKDDKQI